MKLSMIKILLALVGITFAIAQPNSRRTAANPEIYISMQFEWDENKNQLNQQKHGMILVRKATPKERRKYNEYLSEAP